MVEKKRKRKFGNSKIEEIKRKKRIKRKNKRR